LIFLFHFLRVCRTTPTDPPTVLREAKSIEHDRTRVTEVKFGSHTGTHLSPVIAVAILEGGEF
jgi:hypothetical protein